MKQYCPLLLLIFIFFKFSNAQVICIYCYNQNDSISSGITNLLQNGGFENTNCPPSSGVIGGPYSFCPNSSGYVCNFANWTCTGGASNTYCCLYTNIYSVVAEGANAVYFGNHYCQLCSPTVNDISCLGSNGCQATGIPAGYPVNDTSYGGTTGVSLLQTVNGLTIGNIYVLEFWAGGENRGMGLTTSGVFGVDVGFGNIFLRDRPTQPASTDTGTRFIIEFAATATSHTIKFTNWGHICSSCTELVLDDVKLYTLAQLSPIVPACNVPFSANANETDTHCGQCDGSASANPQGGTSPFTYVWNNGATTQNISALCAGPYTVTITDSSGTTATATATVAPTGSADSVNVSANQTIMCPSDSALICATAGFAGYQWNTGDTSQCIYTQLAGNYYVTVTDTSSCTAVSNHITINVYPSPPTSVSVNGDTLTAHGATTYQWYLNGNPIGGATDSMYIATLGGSYTVAVTDTNGCGAVSNAVVISGIETSNNHSGLIIYPNPAYNSFTLQTELKNAELRITDVQGRIISKSQITNYKLQIDISDWSKGVYFVIVRNNETGQRAKVVVE